MSDRPHPLPELIGGQNLPKPKRRLERNASHQIYKLKDGSTVGGCSTIAKLGDSFEGLIRWANQMGLKGIDSSKFRDKTADIGSLSHFMMSCFLDNIEPDLREYDDKDIAKAELGYKKFLTFWEREKLTVVASEIQLVSELYRYGGTLDIVARDEFGDLLICEGKSSKAVYWSHKCQLGGQEGLWNETHDEQISRRAILRIPPTEEGEFQVHWFPKEKAIKYLNIFRAQANLFNVMKDNK